MAFACIDHWPKHPSRNIDTLILVSNIIVVDNVRFLMMRPRSCTRNRRRGEVQLHDSDSLLLGNIDSVRSTGTPNAATAVAS